MGDTDITWTALILIGRRAKVWITGINGRATLCRCMSERQAAIILQRAKQRISIHLIACRREKTAGVIPAEIITTGADCAVEVENIFSRSAGLQNCVPDLQCRAALGTVVVNAAA